MVWHDDRLLTCVPICNSCLAACLPQWFCTPGKMVALFFLLAAIHFLYQGNVSSDNLVLNQTISPSWYFSLFSSPVSKKTILLELKRFPELSRTSSIFRGLPNPGKCHNKIPGFPGQQTLLGFSQHVVPHTSKNTVIPSCQTLLSGK